jgi:hypothetical protein
MANQNNLSGPIRIPNLPSGQITDDKGNATDDELTFRQSLVSLLQDILGPEGLVAPQQDATSIAAIVAATTEALGATPDFVYACPPGNIVYNTTTDTMQVTVLVAGVPTLRTFVLI